MSNKLTNKDLSIATKTSKKVRGRIKDIPKDESKVFMEVVYAVLGPKKISEMKRVSYWFKHDMLENNFKQIIDALEEHPKGKDLVNKVLVNKKAYFTDVIVYGRKFYKPLTWQQKLIVLTEIYNIYNWNGEELDTFTNKKYRGAETFIKVLEEGKIEDWYVSSSSYCDNLESILDNKVSVSDILFWLQNDWKAISGDYWYKKNSNTITRRTTVFADKHYRAFNSVFSRVFGRDLKCIDQFSETNAKGIMNKLKEGLEDNG